MNQLEHLRQYVSYQQFDSLEGAAQDYWIETGHPSALPLLLLAYGHLGRRRKARETLARIEPYESGFDADALVDYGGALMVMLRTDDAIKKLRTALGRQPDHSLGLARLAWCRMALGELDTARELFVRAAKLAPGRIPILSNLATVYLLQEKPQKAQQTVDFALRTLIRLESGAAPPPDFVMAQHHQALEQIQLQIWVNKEQFAIAEEWIGELDSGQETETIARAGNYARLLAEADHHDQATDILQKYLEQFPKSVDLRRYLAELAQVQGRFMQAVTLLRRAIRYDGDNISLWVQLSSACLHRFDKQARRAAKKAIALAEELTESSQLPSWQIKMQRIQAKNALAQVESHGQNYDAAEKIFREILAGHPYFIPALKGLGQQQMQRGNIDEAVELFEKIRQIDPIKGQSVLINARRFPEDEQTLYRMEKAAERPSLEGRVCSGILFNLAAAWEKRSEYDRAMNFARRANEATARFLHYDARAYRNKCARIRDVFSTALFSLRRECGHDATLPVYVLGMPRSGTTLVEQIIAGHSKVFGAGELGVIPSRIQGLNRWERHVGSGRQYPDSIDDLNPYITKGIANGILEELREMAEEDKPGAEYVVDKLPHNFENIGFIKFLFPNAKIISVRRDPRDIAMSNYFTDYQAKHSGMGFAYDLTHIGEQLADHNLLMHHWHQTFPGQILEISYEEVIDDLEQAARKMLDYIGIEWEPSVLKFNELERPVKTASLWQVRQPIYKTSKARWKNYEKHLAPLIKGTNAKIQWDPIDNTITLPEPALLQDGVALYKKGDLAAAELNFKKMLHHNPEHAACNYMVGLVYCSIGHINDAIPLMEKALAKCPWQKEWRQNLIRACEETGQENRIKDLRQKLKPEGELPLSEVLGFEDSTTQPTTNLL